MQSDQELITYHSSLTDHLLGFARYLREKGFLVGIDEVSNALQGIPLIDIGNHARFLDLLRINFSSSREQWNSFDNLYAEYVKEHRKASNSKREDKQNEKDQRSPKPSKGRKKQYQLSDIKQWLFNKKRDLVEVPFYNETQSDQISDLTFLRKEQSEELRDLIKRLVKKLAAIKSRKLVTHRRKGILDQRRLIANKVKKGDELLQLRFKYRKKQQSRVVLICDVSKSMQLYSHFISELVHSLRTTFSKSAVFVFNTELFKLPGDWLGGDWHQTLEYLEEIPGLWTGGTRIGQSLAQLLTSTDLPTWFNDKTKVIIYSDGWDTGDIDMLRDSMIELQEKSGLILWMNPVFNHKEETEILGLKAVKPYVDILANVYNARTLEELIGRL